MRAIRGHPEGALATEESDSKQPRPCKSLCEGRKPDSSSRETPFRMTSSVSQGSMLSEIPDDEFAAALDACAAEVLWEAGVTGPPVDALAVADGLQLVVGRDDCRWHCRAARAGTVGSRP